MIEIRKPKVILNLEKEEKLLLTKFYDVWARKLWKAKLVFYSLEINFAFFSNGKILIVITQKKVYKNGLNVF